MRVAFYAPLKPSDHPVPSGDRRVARLMLQAIRMGGNDVAVASRMRAFEGHGKLSTQNRIRRRGAALARRYIERHRSNPPDLWFTYHLYHKAPDWIGPAVCDALSVPYVVAEASVSPKQSTGPWRQGYAATQAAVTRADRIIVLNPDDRECLQPLTQHPDVLVPLRPFIDTSKPRRAVSQRAANRKTIAHRYGLDAAAIWIAVTAMMRPGDKLESYRVLGRVIPQLHDLPVRWLIAGDGPARDDVLKALGRRNVAALGALDQRDIDSLHSAADLAIWPAMRESFGMALLEAQAAGLPVIAGNTPGVAQIIKHGTTGYLMPSGDDVALAKATRRLVLDVEKRLTMARDAMRNAQLHHDVASAARQLDALLQTTIEAAK